MCFEADVAGVQEEAEMIALHKLLEIMERNVLVVLPQPVSVEMWSSDDVVVC